MAKLGLVFLTVFAVLLTLAAGHEEDKNENTKDAQQTRRIIPGIINNSHQVNRSYKRDAVIRCYSCASCSEKFTLNTPVRECDNAGCITYVANRDGETVIVGGCKSEIGSCARIPSKLRKLDDPYFMEACKECLSDRCNSGCRSVSNTILAAFAIIVTPLLARSMAS